MSRPRARRSPTKGDVGTPALDAWRRELAAGQRTATTFDALWRAACAEMNALDAEAAGLPGIAAGYCRDARDIIHRAAREVG